MKKLLIGAVALSVLATAGFANAQPNRQNDRNDHRYEQGRGQDHRADQHPQRRYSAGRYQPPRGYKAHSWRNGERLPASYRSRGYVVDYRTYGLRAPPRGYQYVRVNNDVVLTAITTGVIASVITSLFQ